jgi:hypothetical protein
MRRLNQQPDYVNQLAGMIVGAIQGAAILFLLYILLWVFIIVIFGVIPDLFPCVINGTCGTHYFLGIRIYPIF